MTAYPNIFTPENDSLEARVHAYKEVLSSYRNAKSSLEHKEDGVLLQTLGSIDEIGFALDIASDSLNLAFSAFDESEIDMIQKEGLLDKSDLVEAMQVKRQKEMSQSRQNQSSHQSSHQQK